MKKYFFLVLYILTYWPSLGQAKIEKYHTVNKTINGSVNDKIDFSIYLSYFTTSPSHMNVYSVKGWFTLGDAPLKVPIVGIYDGGLTLYSFGEDTLKSDSILNFRSKLAVSHWDVVRELKTKTNFLQKWELTSKGEDTVRTPNIDLGIKVYTKGLRVVQEKELLTIAKNMSIDLDQIGLCASGYQLEGQGETKSGHRVLLSFDYMSAAYTLGRCGAGQEKGFLLLTFDSEWNLLDMQQEYVESCDQSIATIDTDHRADFMLVYKLEGTDDTATKLIVDKRQVKMWKGEWRE